MLISLLLSASAFDCSSSDDESQKPSAQNLIMAEGIIPGAPNAEQLFEAFKKAKIRRLTGKTDYKAQLRKLAQQSATGQSLWDLYNASQKLQQKGLDIQNLFVCYKLFYTGNRAFFDKYINQQAPAILADFASLLWDRNEQNENQEEIKLAGLCFETAATKDPEFWENAVCLYGRFQMWDKRAFCAERIKDPHKKWAVLGECHLINKRFEEAYKCLKKAEKHWVKTLPPEEGFLQNLATVSEILGYGSEKIAPTKFPEGGRSYDANGKPLSSNLQQIMVNLNNKNFALAQKCLDQETTEHELIMSQLKLLALSGSSEKILELLNGEAIQYKDFIQIDEINKDKIGIRNNFLQIDGPFYQAKIHIGQNKFEEAKEVLLKTDDFFDLKYYLLSFCAQKQGDMEEAIRFLETGSKLKHLSCINALKRITAQYADSVFKQSMADTSPETKEDAVQFSEEETEDTRAIARTKFSFIKEAALNQIITRKWAAKKFAHDPILRDAMLKCFNDQSYETLIANKNSDFWTPYVSNRKVKTALARIKEHAKDIDWRKEFGPLMQNLNGGWSEQENRLSFWITLENGERISRFLHNPDHTTGRMIDFKDGYHQYILSMLDQAEIPS